MQANACSFQVGFMRELQVIIYVVQPLFPPKVSNQSFRDFYYMKTPDPSVNSLMTFNFPSECSAWRITCHW